MDINFSRILTTLDGQPMREGGTDLTLGAVILGSLLGPGPIDPRTGTPLEPMAPEEQLRRYKIGFMIQGAVGSVSLLAEDVALLKKIIATRHSWPLLVGQALLMLENAHLDGAEPQEASAPGRPAANEN